MLVDEAGWSGEGDFTRLLVDSLKTMEEVAALRVEDAPSSRAEPGYAFLANELYVVFRQRTRWVPARLFGLLPYMRRTREPVSTLEQLAAALASVERIGSADYSDAGMVQYLRTERIVAPYQTRGVKLVELVRIYDAGRGEARS
jgi:hypothetical protein